MKVSLSWLKQYVPIDMTVSDLADALTMAGLEVEGIDDRYAGLETVVVGEVREVLPHPNADRLKVCRVDRGDAIVQVVCGAPNVAEGMKAPLAQVGTVMPNGMQLEECAIRGERSQGMLCSEIELELGADAGGLMVLDAALEPGTPLKTALGLEDTTFEIGLTPNRPDCLSMVGVAREIAAIQGTKMTLPSFTMPTSAGDIHALTSVTIEATDHCPRYSACLVEELAVAPSPFWLQDRLRSVGVRPINNLVDVTNFVMLETGQPLHAFDFDHLADHRIVVRTASQGEPFTTLDQKERKLADHMLMICDGQKPVAVGGVMGGLNSEIEESTTQVLIESACFDPVSVRRTSKALGLSTDASHRFERGVDPDGTLFALNRAASLMADLGGGKLVGGTIDEDYRPEPLPELSLDVDATNRLLGTDLDRERMKDLLESIEFSVQKREDTVLTVRVPSFRVDVSRPRDLMEEVARLSGYNQIPTTFPALPAKGVELAPLMAIRNRLRNILSGYGFSEMINYSFIGADACDRMQLSDDDFRREHVVLLNPISEDMAVMRTSLIPGVLQAVQRNISRQQNDLGLFEIGKIFLPRAGELLPEEKEMLVGCLTGAAQKTAWHAKERNCDFFDIKGAVEGLLFVLGIDDVSYAAEPDDQCHTFRAGHVARIIQGGQVLGHVGEVSPETLEAFDLKAPVFAFELDLEQLTQRLPGTRQMAPIPRFPSTARDITVILDQDVETGRLVETMVGFREALVETVYLFDVFSGEPIPEGKKSASFRVVYRSAERTLDDETVNDIHRQLTHRLITEVGAALPA